MTKCDPSILKNDDGDVNEDYDSKRKLLPWSSIAIVLIVACIGIYDSTSNESGYSGNMDPFRIRTLEDEAYSLESIHKALFPLSWNDRVGFLCATIGLMVAAGGGIGGGGILVPIYILVMKFSPKHAIPLSNVTIFGGAVANNLLNARKRHPLTDRPLIDWDLILVMEPLTIGGALIGAFLNKLLPEGLLVVLLVILLSFTANNTLRKSMTLYAKESAAIKKNSLTKMANDGDNKYQDEAGYLLKNTEKYVEKYESSSNHHSNGDEEAHIVDDSTEGHLRLQKLKNVLEYESGIPMDKIKALVVMFLVVLFMNLMKGGGGFSSPLGIQCGSVLFWVANALMLGWILLVSTVARSYLVTRYELKQKIGFTYVDGDIQWDKRATILYPAICCLAGLFAGMFGVGGGIVKGPLMLAMGVHPKVASGTSACMIFFTSITATTSFIVFGLLVYDYAFICLFLGFFATLVGQISLSYLMKKNERNSYISFSIGAVVLLSAMLMTTESLVSAAENKGDSHGSGGVCGGEY